MTKEDFYNNEKFKATDFMEYKHDIWEFFRRYIYRIKEDRLNITSIKVDRPLYEKLKELQKTFCMFVEHTEEPISIFGIKLEIKDELEELKEHCDELELINQKVMEENERLKLENEQLKQNLDGFLTETIAREEYKQTEELEELQRENKQLQEHLNKFSCNEIPNYNCKDCFQDLKQSLDWANERETEWSNRIEELKTDVEYAKAIITDLLNNSHEYAKQNAEDFIKGEKK